MGDRIQLEATAAGHIAGLAVLDEKGRVVHTTGIATSAAMKARISDMRWLAELRARRLWCVKLERESYIALLGRMEKGDVVILSRSEHDAVFDFLFARRCYKNFNLFFAVWRRPNNLKIEIHFVQAEWNVLIRF